MPAATLLALLGCLTAQPLESTTMASQYVCCSTEDCLGVDVAAGVHHVVLWACKLDFVGLAVVIAVARGCSHAGAVTLDAGRCARLGLLG